MYAEYIEKAQSISTMSNLNDKVFFGAIGACTEANEVLDCMKKWQEKKRKILDINDVAQELGDCIWYIVELSIGLGLDINSIIKSSKAKAGAINDLEWLEKRLIRNSIELAIFGSTLLSCISDIMLRYEDYKGIEVEHMLNSDKPTLTGFICSYLVRIFIIANDLEIDIKNILANNLLKLEERYPEIISSKL